MDAWDDIYWKSVYLTLCLLTLQSLANLKTVRKQSNGRCSWSMFKYVRGVSVPLRVHLGVSVYLRIHSFAYTYSAWASALLVLDGLGNARRLEEWDE